METNLTGKVAIVTGGSAGIGLACVKALLAEGVNVVIASKQRALETADSLRPVKEGEQQKERVFGIKADLTEPGKADMVAQTAIDGFGKIDILINCAGAARAGAFLDLSDQDFLDAWTLKLLGYIRMIRAVLPHMIGRSDGRIVNIIGAAGRTPSATFLAGSTANAALINFTRGISKEIAQHNIRINAISPSLTETERANRLAEQTAQAKGISVAEVMSDSTRSIPIGRLIQPSEIASLAVFLVSDLASSITGAEVLIDGGQTPGM
jgi:3-oxoacyl-[acyl-carrier protein] reductase/bacilysin biosynthesis oxidoreductase BacG